MIEKCNYCDYKYETPQEYRDHLEDKHHKCGICGTVFDSDSEEEWEKHNDCYRNYGK
jgi:hypothetical protein